MNLSIGFLGTQPGFFEMFLIFSAVLLLFGADSLPKFARQFGRLMEELRRASQDFRDQVTKADIDFKNMTRDVWEDEHREHRDYDYYHDDYHHDDYHHDESHPDDAHPAGSDPQAESAGQDAHESDAAMAEHEAHYKDDHGVSALAHAVARDRLDDAVADAIDAPGATPAPGGEEHPPDGGAGGGDGAAADETGKKVPEHGQP